MTDTPQRLRLSSTSDLVEAIPCMLGFRPNDSMVVIAIEDSHIVLTARTDLPDGEPFATHPLHAVWRRCPGADLVVVACCADPGRAWLALEAVDASVPDGTGRLLIHADGSRWYDDPQGEGVSYDAESGAPVVEAALAGRCIRGSRAELAELVRPTCTPEEVEASLTRVADGLVGLGDLCERALALLHAHDDLAGILDLDEATLVCLASHDEQFLDAAILSTDRHNAEQRVDFWLQVVRASVPNCSGFALAALGHAAWLCGDGAFQVVCLEAMEGRPGPSDWATFLSVVNVEAIPPDAWPHIRDAFGEGGQHLA